VTGQPATGPLVAQRKSLWSQAAAKRLSPQVDGTRSRAARPGSRRRSPSGATTARPLPHEAEHDEVGRGHRVRVQLLIGEPGHLRTTVSRCRPRKPVNSVLSLYRRTFGSALPAGPGTTMRGRNDQHGKDRGSECGLHRPGETLRLAGHPMRQMGLAACRCAGKMASYLRGRVTVLPADSGQGAWRRIAATEFFPGRLSRQTASTFLH
jgi:hypothetical protein